MKLKVFLKSIKMILLVFLNGLYIYTLVMTQTSIMIIYIDGKVKKLNQKDGLGIRLLI